MAFKSNNEIIIINVIKHGADLNITNNKNNTALAFASRAMIDKLGLLNGIVSGNTAGFDNNKLLSDRKSP